MVEKFEFDSKLKKNLFIMMGVGVLGLVWAFLAGLHDGHHQSRFWSNILLNAYYFTGIGIFGIFFVAASQLGYAGWITLVKRIFMSLSGFIKIGAVFALLIVGGVWAGYHNLYHWAEPGYLAGIKFSNTKQIFFNPTFWSIRVVLYFVLWIFVGNAVVKAINAKNIGDEKVYKKSKLMAALWIVIFAVSESFVSWDMIMSTDAHWYSTLFGWYNFASYGCAAFAFTILLIIFLKSRGYLPQVNENHLQDVGKMMFGFSILWTYLWFDQFMLQWYGNIPEDTKYWVKRFDVPLFKVTIFLALIINFAFPLFIFIKRSAKRSYKTAAFIAVMVIFGHYVDFFNMIMYEPNVIAETKECCKKGEGECCKKKEAAIATGSTALYAENKTADKTVVKEEKAATDAPAEKAESKPAEEAKSEAKAEEKSEAKEGEAKEGKEGKEGEEAECGPQTRASLGVPELLIFTGFLGMFLFMFFNEFSKDTTFNENDPYLKESLRHHVEYA
jgi:hypothetical protein